MHGAAWVHGRHEHERRDWCCGARHGACMGALTAWVEWVVAAHSWANTDTIYCSIGLNSPGKNHKNEASSTSLPPNVSEVRTSALPATFSTVFF